MRTRSTQEDDAVRRMYADHSAITIGLRYSLSGVIA